MQPHCWAVPQGTPFSATCAVSQTTQQAKCALAYLYEPSTGGNVPGSKPQTQFRPRVETRMGICVSN